MRWDELFADLEAQAEALETAERAAEIDERTRIELAALGLGDRLRAATGATLSLRLAGGVAITGSLDRAGADWLLISEASGREALVAVAALLSVGGLGRAAAVPGSAGRVHARLTLRSAVRGLARDRSPVRVHLVDGTVVDGTLDRVGADFADLAVHAPGETRRRGEVRASATVALGALAAITRGAG